MQIPGVSTMVAMALGAALAGSCLCGGPVPPPPDGDGGVDGGADAGMDSGVPDAGLTPATTCPLLVDRRCGALARCGVIPDTEPARRECAAAFTVTWCGPTQWLAHVERGVLRFDSAKAQACADAWQLRACTEWNTDPDACDRFLSPNVQLGGACYDSFAECQEGVCRGAACPRSCQPRGLEGDVCRFGADCRVGLFCRPLIPGTGQCTAYGLLDAMCDPTRPCADGLWCENAKCAVLPPAGQACLAGHCDDSTFCNVGLDGGTCEPRAAVDGGCVDDSRCVTGAVCEAVTSTCQPVVVAQGAPCGARQECPAGLVCLGLAAAARGQCAAPVGSGVACVSSNDCQAHLACGRVDGGYECGPRRTASQSCVDTRDCQAFTMCLGTTCTPVPSVGRSCAATQQCQWGVCLDIGDGGAVCADAQGPGARCTTGSECASGRCEAGQCLASCVP